MDEWKLPVCPSCKKQATIFEYDELAYEIASIKEDGDIEWDGDSYDQEAATTPAIYTCLSCGAEFTMAQMLHATFGGPNLVTRFHKTVISVEVLSTGPFEWDDLGDVLYEITRGSASGYVGESWSCKLTLDELIAECDKHNTDPTYFTEFAEDEDCDDLVAEQSVCLVPDKYGGKDG